MRVFCSSTTQSKSLVNYSQGIARFYDLFPPAGPDHDEAAQFLLTLLQPGCSVLEIGAGVGNTALALAESNIRVTVLEPDAEMYSVMLARLALRPELQARITPLMQPAGHPLNDSFDACASFAVYHLLQPEERIALLSYAAERVKQSGSVVFEIPMAARTREAKPWSEVAHVTLGDLRIEHHSATEPAGDGWWYTHWVFRVLHGGTLIEEAKRTFHWYPSPYDEVRHALKTTRLNLVHAYAGYDRSPYVKHESRALLLVAHPV